MVVEKFYCQWRISCICFSLFNFLFYDKIRNNRTNSNTFVFWLHWINGFNILVINWYNRIFCSLCIYSKNIRCCKNRLVNHWSYQWLRKVTLFQCVLQRIFNYFKWNVCETKIVQFIFSFDILISFNYKWELYLPNNIFKYYKIILFIMKNM